MLKTLHGYLSRELAKVTVLALVAFTLIMTVFAIIEPMRKYGFEPDEALALIAFTLPMMMSLTLPVAALFAATIVYGRFGQDNEMLACRASGISTISMLKPALGLGGIVTAVSLTLISLVIPQMVMLVETAVKADVRNIAYGQLRRKTYVEWEGVVVHADRVDEENNALIGVVVVDTKDPEDIMLIVAPRALVDFQQRGDEAWIKAHLINPVAARTGDYRLFSEASHPADPWKLPSLAEEEPSWYSWGKLLRTLQNPAENQEIKNFLERIQQELCYDMLAQAIVSKIEAGKAYTELGDDRCRYQIRAGAARKGREGKVILRSANREDGRRWPVEVTILRDGRPHRLISAESGWVRSTVSQLSDDAAPFVTIKLFDGVSVRDLAEGRASTQRRLQWAVGQLPIPSRFLERSRKIKLEHVVRRAEELTDDKKILKKIRRLETDKIRRLLNKVKAEMHMRAAYSLSCCLMVAMGAALGLLLRGGQIVSAFAITAIPASLVIVLMIMGKQMVHSKTVEAYVGLITIWVGVVALFAADVVVYFVLSRR